MWLAGDDLGAGELFLLEYRWTKVEVCNAMHRINFNSVTTQQNTLISRETTKRSGRWL